MGRLGVLIGDLVLGRYYQGVGVLGIGRRVLEEG